MKAFLLVGLLVALSAVISLAFVMIRSNLKNQTAGSVPEIELPAVTIETEQSAEPAVIDDPPPRVPEPSMPAVSAAPVRPQSDSTVRPVSTSSQQPAQNQGAATTVRNVSSTSSSAAVTLGTLVFIIDDAGNNLRELEPFLALPGSLTIAVLPGLPYSAEAARRIRAAGKEVFLHQPMEALGGQNPGPGAIYSGMDADEIRAILKQNIVEVGPVAGINNHQGSKITMDNDAVQTILAFCAEQGLVFLDSRTTADTVVPSEAQRMGIKIGERDIFLDNEQDKDSMMRYLTSGLGRARQNGGAVMIGHTWSPELAPLLAEEIPRLEKQGYTLKNASAIIKAK